MDPRHVVIAYDISSNARRRRMARLLDDYGDRVQKSVFHLLIPPDRLADVIAAAESLLDDPSDALLVLRLCSTCAEHAQFTGGCQPKTLPLYWIV